MAVLRTVLALNMKNRRHILGITQEQLAERVNTSTNYIALIETKKKFPKPEFLERLAAALEIDPPALFTAEIRPIMETELLERVQKQMLSDLTRVVSQVVSHHIDELKPSSSQ